MERVLEPEIMDDKAQAIAYAKADFSSSNQMFVDGLLGTYGSQVESVLDIGCGPADIPIRLAKARPSIRVTAVDASDVMVRLAGEAVREAGLARQITVIQGRLPGLALAEPKFDAIVSKDLLHHLPDPAAFWGELGRRAVGRTVVYVMDLFRPGTEQGARDIVKSVSANEPEILQRDFYNSLLAAFTPDEVRAQLHQAGLGLDLAVISDRHMLVQGILD